MKRIVLLSPAYPLRGGIASSTERLAQALQEQGCKVTIFSFSLQYPSLLFPGKTQYADGPPPKGLDIVTTVNSVNPLNWIKVGRQLKKMAPDLIIARYWIPFIGPSMGTILRIAKRNGKTKAIAITDNVIPHEKRPGDRLLTSYFIKSVDAFVVMSRSVMDDIRQFSSEKPVSYIPHPIYDNYGKPVNRTAALEHLSLSSSTSYLLFFGFIRAYKGLDLLLKAMADDRIRKLGLKLIIAGEFYGSSDQYDQLIREEGLQDEVVLKTHYIPSEEVRYYFGAADLVVQPYKSATQSGISQLAYHFEKPMVVTRVGGLPEIVAHEKEGYVVEVKVEAIADAIVDYFENQRREKMSNGVREGKKRFSWDNMVEGIRNLYSQL